MVVAGDGTPPYIFTSRASLRSTNSEAATVSSVYPDTSGFERRTVPLGLPTPGELRVIPLNYSPSSGLTGRYQWAYAFGANDTIQDTTLFGPQGEPSKIVALDGQAVYITGFLHRPYALTDSVDSVDYNDDNTLTMGYDPATQIRLARRNVDGGNWLFVDSFWVVPDSSVAYIDSGQGGTDNIALLAASGSIPEPGSIIKYAMATSSSINASPTLPTWWAYDDSTYYLRYSWYDPVLDIESPMGPATPIAAITDSIGSSQWGAVFGTLNSRYSSDSVPNSPYEPPTDWIRLYRNLTDEGLLGGGDTLIWYCMGQYRINRVINSFLTGQSGSIILGIYSDSQLAAGTTPTSAQLGWFHYSDENIASDDDGAIVRPPYKFGNSVYYTDIEYANGRLWGIGDAIYPQRLYYSKFDDMGDWSPNDYLSLSEDDNDELVAVEAVGDILYAFKHNSIFAVTGTDAEYDLQFSVVTRRTGALDRYSVIKYEDEIFWLSPDMKIYSSIDFQPISDPIENYLDSLFTDYTSAQDSVRAFALTDKVCWVQINSREAIAFDLTTRTWDRENYSGYVPYGSFQYDTLANVRGFGENSWLMFRADTAQSFMVEQLTGTDTVQSGSVFTWQYQTPFVGDGVSQWNIPYVEFTATADDSTYIIVSVFNEDGDSLVSDSVMVADVSETTYRIGLPRHSGQFLSVRFEDNGGIKLSSVNVGRKRVGRARIK